MTIEERLEKIERELAALREGGAVTKVVRANKFALVDENSKTRVILDYMKNQARKKGYLYDE
jgi:hypothetical protein